MSIDEGNPSLKRQGFIAVGSSSDKSKVIWHASNFQGQLVTLQNRTVYFAGVGAIAKGCYSDLLKQIKNAGLQSDGTFKRFRNFSRSKPVTYQLYRASEYGIYVFCTNKVRDNNWGVAVLAKAEYEQQLRALQEGKQLPY